MKDDYRLQFRMLIESMTANQRLECLDILLKRVTKELDSELARAGWRVSVVPVPIPPDSRPRDPRGGQR